MYKFISRIQIVISNFKKIIWFPIILINAIVPFFVYLQSAKAQDLEYVVQYNISVFYPLCIMVLFIIMYRSFLDESGRELLYLYNHIKLLEGGSIFTLISLLMVISNIIFYKNMIEDIPLFCLKNLIIIFSFCGLCYFFIYLFSSLVIGIIPVIIFYLLTIIGTGNIEDIKWINYSSNSATTLQEVLYSTILHLIIGNVCMVGGIILNKLYKKY